MIYTISFMSSFLKSIISLSEMLFRTKLNKLAQFYHTLRYFQTTVKMVLWL